jgi:hypothetical protein
MSHIQPHQGGVIIHMSVSLQGVLSVGVGMQIVTISGRTIRKEAQASPELAESAIKKIEDLLASLPQEVVERAKELRSQRRIGTA